MKRILKRTLICWDSFDINNHLTGMFSYKLDEYYRIGKDSIHEA